jgi:hypothetical protein
VEGLAARLAVAPVTDEEEELLLAVARDVAHGVERKVTPIAAFVLGEAVGARVAAGEDRSSALDGAIADLRSALPGSSEG